MDEASIAIVISTATVAVENNFAKSAEKAGLETVKEDEEGGHHCRCCGVLVADSVTDGYMDNDGQRYSLNRRKEMYFNKKKTFYIFLCYLLFTSQGLLGSYQESFTVSLLEFPSCKEAFLNHDKPEYTLPDLHGNALKLLNALIALGVLDMDEVNYKKFHDFYYKKETSFDEQDLINLRGIFSSLTLTKTGEKPFIRFIGDELCDRGSNDYYTLLLIARMIELGIKCEFIASNHGFEFVHAYENGDFLPVGLKGRFSRSLTILNFFIAKQLVSKQEVENLVEGYYKPNLKILSYSVSKNSKSVVIYSHAPIGLKEIEELAKSFKIMYKDEDINNLTQTIDKINNKFQEEYVKKNQVHSIFSILVKFLWNRNYTNLHRPSIHNGYEIKFVHGHDSGEKSISNIYNLDFDNYLGKTRKDVVGMHQIFIFKDLMTTK